MVLKLVENFLGGWTELTCLCAILRFLWIAPEKILISPQSDGAAQMASKFTWGEFIVPSYRALEILFYQTVVIMYSMSIFPTILTTMNTFVSLVFSSFPYNIIYN